MTACCAGETKTKVRQKQRFQKNEKKRRQALDNRKFSASLDRGSKLTSKSTEMPSEIITIDGWPTHHRSEKMSYLKNLKADLTDKEVWMNAGKATLGGGVAAIVVDEGAKLALKWDVLAKVGSGSPKMQSIFRNGLKGLMGVTTAVIAGRYIGEAAAMGAVGATAGHALAREVESFLPFPAAEEKAKAAEEKAKSAKGVKVLSEPKSAGAGALPDGSVGRHFSDAELQQHLSEMRA